MGFMGVSGASGWLGGVGGAAHRASGHERGRGVEAALLRPGAAQRLLAFAFSWLCLLGLPRPPRLVLMKVTGERRAPDLP